MAPPNEMTVPMAEFVANAARAAAQDAAKKAAREAASTALTEYRANCPLEQRLRRVELRFAALVGFMTGSGFLGGFAGGMLANLLK